MPIRIIVEGEGTDWRREHRVFTCTPDDPFNRVKWPSGSGRVEHSDVHEVTDYGETVEYMCGNCGAWWDAELPQ